MAKPGLAHRPTLRRPAAAGLGCTGAWSPFLLTFRALLKADR